MTLSDADLLAIARELCDCAGKPAPIGLRQLAGGRNNRVFEVSTAQGPALVLKSYFADPRDPRDRLATEWQFLSYAWRRGVRVIPEPLAKAPASHCGLYAFVPGRRIAAGEVTAVHVDAAIDFVLAVNGPPREVTEVPVASEACFTLAEHVSTVERRVQRLVAIDSHAPHREAAERFVAAGLKPAWAMVKAKIDKDLGRLGLDPDERLAPEDIVVSPSDFGFHNALLQDTGHEDARHGEAERGKECLAFIDFEYAGRDDPAKLICDFFCQPQVPVPLLHFDRFAGRVLGGLGLAGPHEERCRLLLDAYRIKWACILLNDFLPVGAARRAFADGPSREARCSAQLAKARQAIAALAIYAQGH